MERQQFELSLWKYREVNNQIKEEKLYILRDNEMSDSRAAFDISLKENINGEKTLTFKLLRRIEDEFGHFIENPFLKFLNAEILIKLRDGAPYEPSLILNNGLDSENRWYDFVIKNVEEDSKSFINTYTCKEKFINELGKNGWNVILDDKLKNNYGDIFELGERILKGSDWEIDKEASTLPNAQNSQPILLLHGVDNVTIKSLLDGHTLSVAPSSCYAFYQDMETTNNNSNYYWSVKKDLQTLQVLYFPADAQILLNDRNIIIDELNKYNYIIETGFSNLTGRLVKVSDNTNLFQSEHDGMVCGNRIMQVAVSHYEPNLDKVVQDYEVIKNDGITVPGDTRIHLNKGDLVYRTLNTEYVAPDIVTNILTNTKDFVSSLSWSGITDKDLLKPISFPFYQEGAVEGTADASPINYLSLLNYTSGTSHKFYNEGPGAPSIRFRVEKDSYYVLRWKARLMSDVERKNYSDISSEIANHICANPNLALPVLKATLGYRDGSTFTACTNTIVMSNDLSFNNDTTKPQEYGCFIKGPETRTLPSAASDKIYFDSSGYAYAYFKGTNDTQFLDKKINLELQTINSTAMVGWHWYLEDIQVFEYKSYINEGNEIPIFLGDVITSTEINIDEKFYIINVKSPSNPIVWLPNKAGYYKPKYNIVQSGNPPKYQYPDIRHIEVKESTYFNNINNLAELFKVWVSYKVKHNANGKIFLKEKNGVQLPDKRIVFKRNAPIDTPNSAGFKYGVNIDNIKRTIDSAQVATKIIVKDNVNKYGKDGICSITRAKSNPSKEKIIYDFDYLLSIKNLDVDNLLRDLYGTMPNDLQYYRRQYVLNSKLLPIEEEIAIYTDKRKHFADGIQAIDIGIQQYEAQISDKRNELAARREHEKKEDLSELEAAINSMLAHQASLRKEKVTANQQLQVYEQMLGIENDMMKYHYTGLYVTGGTYKNNDLYYKEKSIVEYPTPTAQGLGSPDDCPLTLYYWNGNSEVLVTDAIFKKIGLLNQSKFYGDCKNYIELLFTRKYRAFVQEGTWTDSKYIDDELYYLDAMKVAEQNAYPKITYNIGVLDIQDTIDISAYHYQIGETTFIEDPEFFGYTDKKIGNEVVQTPFRKEAIINERTRNLDNPSKSSLTIKTYSNQFEELFSKMAATTTSLNYAKAGYDNAATVVQPNGQIDVKSIEETLAHNKWVFASTTNEGIQWDSTKGLTLTNQENPMLAVRLASIGIGMTRDGGKNWFNAITGNGINTNLLTAGAIDAGSVNILNTVNGHADYAFQWNANGLNALCDGSKGNKYVRFNKYGLFGTVKGIELDDAITNETDFDAALQTIRDKSTFSLTWDGLLLKYQDGATSLDPIYGLQIFDNISKFTDEFLQSADFIHKISENDPTKTANYTNQDLIPLVAIGKMPDRITPDTFTYGLRMRNKQGEVTLDTGNDGNLWLLNTLTVGDTEVAGYTIESRQRVTSVSSVRKNDNSHIVQFRFYNPKITTEPTTDPLVRSLSLEYKLLGKTEYTAAVLTSVNDIADLTDGTGSLVANKYYAEDYEGLNPRLASNEVSLYILNIEIPNDKAAAIQHADYDLFFQEDKISNKALSIYGYQSSTDQPILEVGGYSTDNTVHPNLMVTSNGTLLANDATISGSIVALEGQFLGDIKVGNNGSAGISGIDGSPYIFWAGKKLLEDPVFSVSATGRMICEDGKFTGNITATEGVIHKLHFGSEKGANYLGSGNNDEDYVHIGNNFRVAADGHVYGKTLSLAPFSNELETDYGIKIGDSTNIIKIQNMLNGQLRTVFSVDNIGNIIMQGNLTTNDGINIGNIHIKKDSNGVNYIGAKPGSAYSWKINDDGYAEFNNISVRGKIDSAVFNYDKKSAVSGELVITPGVVLTEDILGEINGNNYIFALNSTTLANQFEIWAHVTNADIILPNIDNVYSGIISADSENQIITIAIAIDSKGITNKLPKGSQIIVTAGNVNTIKMSAKNAAGPYIRMDGPSLGSGIQPHCVVLGNLSEVNSDLFSGSGLLGDGLYANNAYLEGKLYLPNAGITNEGNNLDSVRLWAGTSATNKRNAPFRVTQDGSLYAEKGVFKGEVIAEKGSFSGQLKAAGIMIDSNSNNQWDLDTDHFYAVKAPTGTTMTLDNIESNNTIYKYSDYILDINNNGLNIFNNGFNIYSSLVDNPLFRLAKDANFSIEVPAMPVVDFINEASNPRIRALGIEAIDAITTTESGHINTKVSSTFIKGSSIGFRIGNDLTALNTLDTASFAMSVGYDEAGKGYIKANHFNITDQKDRILLGCKEQRVTIPFGVAFETGSIQAISDSNGIVFNYIGGVE